MSPLDPHPPSGRPARTPAAGDGPEPAAGRLVGGRYRLHRSLGRGGMGVVWAARDETLDRDIAVKEVTLPPGLDERQRTQLRERTLREARAAARIRSEAAVTVYDVVEEDGRPWIVMELLPARSLADVVREEGPLPPDAAARTGLRVLEALSAAHAAGVLHRDVKPANVLFDETGRAVLTDFGIASLEGDPSMTTTGTVVGSPGYVAPERALGRPPTAASDLWSLGVTLAAAVHGRSPFERDTPLATIVAAMQDPLPEAVVTGPLGQLVDRLLQKDPAMRADAEEARRLLQDAASDRAHAGPTAVLPVVAPGAAPLFPPRPGSADAELTQALPRVRPAPAGRAARPSFPAAATAARPAPATTPSRPRPGAGTAAAGRRSRLLPVLLGLAAVVAALMVAVVALGRPDAGTTATGEPTAAAAATGPAPEVVAPVEEAPAEPEQPLEDTAAAPAAPAAPVAPEAGNEGDEGEAAGAGQDGGQGEGQGEGQGGGQDEGQDGGGGQDEDADQGGGDGQGAGVAPEGFTLYEDPGYRVAVPQGWTVDVQSEIRTIFQDPSSRRYLLVEEGGEPAGDPVEDWEQQEASLRQSGRLRGYELLGIERADFRDFDAADWQFRWQADAGPLRVLNRAVVDEDLDRAYALYWSVPAEDWDASRGVFDAIARSFQPLG